METFLFLSVTVVWPGAHLTQLHEILIVFFCIRNVIRINEKKALDLYTDTMFRELMISKQEYICVCHMAKLKSS